MTQSRIPSPTSPPWRDTRSRPVLPQESSGPDQRPPMPQWQMAIIAVVAVSLAASLGLLAWSLVGQRSVAAIFQVGECANDVPFDGTPVTEVVKVDCDQIHQVEVYALVGMPGDGPYPGDQEVDARAGQLCRTAASAELVGLDPGWQLKALRPSVESWDQSDRTVTCFLTRTSGNRTAGSITSG